MRSGRYQQFTLCQHCGEGRRINEPRSLAAAMLKLKQKQVAAKRRHRATIFRNLSFPSVITSESGPSTPVASYVLVNHPADGRNYRIARQRDPVYVRAS